MPGFPKVVHQRHSDAGVGAGRRRSLPEVHHEAHRREGVPHIAVKLRLPLELADIAPMVACLPVGAGVPEGGEMHDRGGVPVRPPKLGLGGQEQGVEVAALLRGRVHPQEILVELLSEGGGGAVPVEPEPAVLVDDNRVPAVVVDCAALRDRVGAGEVGQPEVRILEVVGM